MLQEWLYSPCIITSNNITISTMERFFLSGVSILVVSGGIGNLTFAIEAHRKGHDVRV